VFRGREGKNSRVVDLGVVSDSLWIMLGGGEGETISLWFSAGLDAVRLKLGEREVLDFKADELEIWDWRLPLYPSMRFEG